MLDDEDSVTKKLLSPVENISITMDSATIENEKGVGNEVIPQKEPDLRLHDAVCEPDNDKEIETLVEEEPNLVFERDNNGCTPLHCIAQDADEEMAIKYAKLLLGVSESADGTRMISIERPELLNMQSNAKLTALHKAAERRDVNFVGALLRWGADPYLQDKNGNTCLHLASTGMLESAVQCATLILKKSDINNNPLINLVNNEGKAAIHKAIDERSVLMSKFLLRPENKYNLSQTDSNGWNILHYICSGTDESDSLLEIVKVVVRRCNSNQLNQLDNKQRTPLHLAVIQRLPQIAQIIVNEDNTEVTRVDEVGKTALHYACINGCYPKGQQCVEILIGRKFPDKKETMNYLYKNEDKHRQTPFNYACINCPPETVQKYLQVLDDPQSWLTGTYMTLLYKHCPLALKTLMDNAFREDKKRSTDFEDEILVDYGPLTGYLDTVDVQPQQETRYLKQALYWEYSSQKEVLTNPLVQIFFLRKWHKLRFIILGWVIWQLIWLGAFTTLIISYYAKAEATHSKPVTLAASFIMLLYILTSLVNECFELYTVKCAYLLSLTNLTQLAQNFLAFFAISPVLANLEEPQTWQKYATATGILLAYILSMRDIGKLHNKIGLVVEVLKQVLIQIVLVLLSCAPLWIGFTLCFVVIFDDDEALNSTFPGPIVKVLVMMTGEFEYNDTFKDESGEGGKTVASMTNRIVKLLFFLSFLISVPVAFFNLLTGFALDKVMELRERAKVGRILKQLEHIYFIESILLSLRPLGKVFPAFENCLRKLNVTTAWIDQKRRFHTVIREKVKQSEKRNLGTRRIDGCLSGLMPSFCGANIPMEVEEQIFALATANSNSSIESSVKVKMQ